MVNPPRKTTRSRISSAMQVTPWQEIALTPYGDNSLNLVLSLSKEVRLETAGNQFNGGLLSLCREAKFLIIVPYLFEIKSPLSTQRGLS